LALETFWSQFLHLLKSCNSTSPLTSESSLSFKIQSLKLDFCQDEVTVSVV